MRTPHYARIGESHLPDGCAEFAKNVGKRTDTTPFINKATRAIDWCYMLPNGGIQPVWNQAFQGPNSMSVCGARFGTAHENEIVKVIYSGKATARVKDRIIAQRERDYEYERDQRLDKENADKRPDSIAQVEYAREARGMGSHWKKSVVVNGLRDS